MTNPSHDPQPIERPPVDLLYRKFLCEVHAMQIIQNLCWGNPTTRMTRERAFREQLVDMIVREELKTLQVTTDLKTLYIDETEIPY